MSKTAKIFFWSSVVGVVCLSMAAVCGGINTGALALILLYSTIQHVPKIVTGLVGVAFIVLSLVYSVKYNRKNLKNV